MHQKIPMFITLVFITACNNRIKLVESSLPECHPQKEVCDGKDNDCDEEIDEDVFIDCSNACGTGKMTCVLGLFSHCSAPALEPDNQCDGIDNDCDGQMDEDARIFTCYPRGEADPNNYKEVIPPRACQFGVKYCIDGAYSCIGAVEPTAEICDGKGKDEDCDGQIDEEVAKSLDIVLILDESCSMMPKIQELVNVTVKWVAKYKTRNNLHCSLVTLSGVNHNDGIPILEKNFSNVNDFIDILKIQKGNENGGLEASIDAVYDISTPTNPLGLNWTPGAKKIIIVYSDEDPQSFQSPNITEAQAINEAKNNNVEVYVFTADYYLKEWNLWQAQIFPKGLDLEKALDEIIGMNSCK